MKGEMKNVIVLCFLAFLVSAASSQYCEIRGYQCVYRGVTLNKNKILPESLNYDSGTKQVQFFNSNVSSIPSELFQYFSNLQELSLRSQNVEEIKLESFKNAKNLRILELNINQIEILPKNSFVGAEKLEEIDLNNNKIHKIELGAFNGIKNLKKLRLGNNKLKEVSEKLFESLGDLETIGLNINEIEFLHQNLFKANKKLRFIFLNNNKLDSLPSNFFSHLVNLNTLNLEKNKCVNKFWISKAYANITEIQEQLTNCNENYQKMSFSRFEEENSGDLDHIFGGGTTVKPVNSVNINELLENFNKLASKVDNFEKELKLLNQKLDQQTAKILKAIESNYSEKEVLAKLEAIERNLERKLNEFAKSSTISPTKTTQSYNDRLVFD